LYWGGLESVDIIQMFIQAGADPSLVGGEYQLLCKQPAQSEYAYELQLDDLIQVVQLVTNENNEEGKHGTAVKAVLADGHTEIV
jgi:hypothetical protein